MPQVENTCRLFEIMEQSKKGNIKIANASTAVVTRQSNKQLIYNFVVESVRTYLACAEPLKARVFLEQCVPVCAQEEHYVKDLKTKIEGLTKHAYSFDEFKAFYSGFSMEHGGALKDTSLLDFDRYSHLLNILIEEKPTNVLDIGCGDGIVDDQILAVLPETKLTIADISDCEHVITALNKKHQNRVLFHKTEKNLYDWPDKKYDCVVLAEVIEHVPDPLFFLSELKKRLTAKGVLIVTTPDADFWIEFGKKPEKQLYHIVAHNPIALYHLATKAGFEVEKITISAEQHIVMKARANV